MRDMRVQKCVPMVCVRVEHIFVCLYVCTHKCVCTVTHACACVRACIDAKPIVGIGSRGQSTDQVSFKACWAL